MKSGKLNRSAKRRVSRVLFRHSVRDFLLYKLALLGLALGLTFTFIGAALFAEHKDGEGTIFFGLGLMFVTLSLSVLIIDHLSAKRNRFVRWQEYVATLRSRNNSFAIQGIENLRSSGWLTDGALCGTKYLGANWVGADLSEADLRGTELLDVDLTDTCLDDADLEGATLTNAKHRNVKLPRILPNSMKLQSVRAEWIDLKERDLTGVRLDNARLRGAQFDGSDLTDASFTGADLTETNLHHAKSVKGVDFAGAILNRTKLPTDLAEARFVESQMRNIDLSGHQLSNALFDRATLQKRPTSEGVRRRAILRCDLDSSGLERAGAKERPSRRCNSE